MTAYCFISHLYYCDFLLLRGVIFFYYRYRYRKFKFFIYTRRFLRTGLLGLLQTACTITLLHVHTGSFIFTSIYFLTRAYE